MEGSKKSRKRKSIIQHSSTDIESTPISENRVSDSNIGANDSIDVQPAIPPIRHDSQRSSSVHDSVPRSDSTLFPPILKRKYKQSPTKSFTASLTEFSTGIVSKCRAPSMKRKRLPNFNGADPSLSSGISSFSSPSSAVNSNIPNYDNTPATNIKTNRSPVQTVDGTCPVTVPSGRINNELFASIPTSSLRNVSLLQDIGKWRLRRNRVQILCTKKIYTSQNLRNVSSHGGF